MAEIARRRLDTQENVIRSGGRPFDQISPYRPNTGQESNEDKVREILSVIDQQTSKLMIGTMTTTNGELKRKYPAVAQLLENERGQSENQQEYMEKPDKVISEYISKSANINFFREIQARKREKILKAIKEKALKIIRDKESLDDEIEDMGLFELRQLHQILFEEAIRAGKEHLGDNFSINVLRKKVDNTFEHMNTNMCSNPVQFCNRRGCDHYDRDCVTKKIRDQINRIASEILNLSSEVA